jgi:type I restriction enzyme R subunit
MDKVINFFTVKGIIEPAMLFEAPYTDSSTSGLIGVFSQSDALKIIEVIEGINEAAVA